jgi:hypothetical protein
MAQEAERGAYDVKARRLIVLSPPRLAWRGPV